jgi:hypothetical protein
LQAQINLCYPSKSQAAPIIFFFAVRPNIRDSTAPSSGHRLTGNPQPDIGANNPTKPSFPRHFPPRFGDFDPKAASAPAPAALPQPPVADLFSFTDEEIDILSEFGGCQPAIRFACCIRHGEQK